MGTMDLKAMDSNALPLPQQPLLPPRQLQRQLPPRPQPPLQLQPQRPQQQRLQQRQPRPQQLKLPLPIPPSSRTVRTSNLPPVRAMTCPDQLAAQDSTHSKAWTCPPSTTTTTTTALVSTAPMPVRPILPTSTLELSTSPPWKLLQNRQPQPQPQQRQQLPPLRPQPQRPQPRPPQYNNFNNHYFDHI